MKSSTIEFFARAVENTFDLAQHLYIVSSDSQGHKKILRAGTGRQIRVLECLQMI